jgi:hypothetical protein
MKKSQKKSSPIAAQDDVAVRSSGVEAQPSSDGSSRADEEIRMRAYELYCERGEQAGDEMTDWLQAEREYYGNIRDDEAIERNPPRTTTGGWFTAPKFGAAGSGGAELEPGPERD